MAWVVQIPDVFAFVVFVDGNVAAVGLQVVHLNSSVGVVFHRECRVDHPARVVLPATSQSTIQSTIQSQIESNHHLHGLNPAHDTNTKI